jgi:hypothetical protein
MSNYCNDKEFLELIKEYQRTKSKKLHNEIARIFISIAEGYLRKSSFINYTEDRKKEMISDSTYYMCKKIDTYDTTREKPFPYFTSFVKNAVNQYLNERNKYNSMFTSIEYLENFNDRESDKSFE